MQVCDLAIGDWFCHQGRRYAVLLHAARRSIIVDYQSGDLWSVARGALIHNEHLLSTADLQPAMMD